MKLQLIMIGGIYGLQALEPVDLIDLPSEVRAFATELASGEGSEPGDPAPEAARTERQTFRVEISRDDGTKVTYSWPETARASEPRVDRLIDALWRVAKPARQPRAP
jgi:hypothetical protein